MSNTVKQRNIGATSLLQSASNEGDVKKKAESYVEFFDKNKGSEENRKENYEEVVNAYYDLATDFYEYGWGKSFHFATQAKDESFEKALARHEHFLALKMKLNEGDVVLDTGCGVGGPAREIARFSGCKVVGLNNNAYQVKRANMHTKNENMTEQVSFVKGNFMDIPAEANTYDGVYAIEATCHAPDKIGVYSEIFRVLKPGKVFTGYEWCMTDKYDPSSEEHRDIKLGIEEGDGIPDLAMTSRVAQALREVGFEVLEARDLADESELPWYSPLVGGWNLKNFRATKIGRWCTHKMVTILEYCRLAPKGTVTTHNFLLKAGDCLVQGGKTGTFTPMYFFVARKPE